MRKLLGLGLLALIGCAGSTENPKGTSDPGPTPSPDPTTTVQVQQAKSTLERNLAPSVPDADKTTLENDNQAFALGAFAGLAKDPAHAGNLFFSPYSISSALAMTYAGAGGTTATEMASALHFTLPQAQLHPAFDAVDLTLNTTAPADADGDVPFTLHVVDSLWGEKNTTFGQPFLDTIAQNYGAGVNLEDFINNPSGSETNINTWVSQQTDGKIQNLLNGAITPQTELVLVNAIYFDADWQSPFEASATSPGTFTTTTGAVSASMMHSNNGGLAVHTAAYDAVELPYRGTSVMDIVIPTAGTIDTFDGALTSASLQTIIAGLETHDEVDLTLPKFGYQGNAFSLAPLLQGLGMNTAFTKEADFSAIAPGIFISDVIQKAFLRVDEKGTEAAAATAVIVGGAAVGHEPQSPITITVDHPFFFTIRETSTNTILFAGRITDPTK